MLKQLGHLCGVGVIGELLWLSVVGLGPLREHFWPFLMLTAGAFAVCLWGYLRVSLDASCSAPVMLAFALLFRLTVLPAPPYQSEDVYRYLWDARVASAGLDPYRFPPDARELFPLRDAKIYPILNTKSYLTAYPPASQMIFRAVYRFFGDRVTPMKTAFSLIEFAALILAWRLLIRLRLRPQALYLWAWNPFFIFEFSGSGHSDSAMMFFVALSWMLLSLNRRSWGMVSYAGAVLSKLHPALWFPLYFRRAGLRASAAGILAGVLAGLLYFTPTSLVSYLHSLRLYYRLFEFNAGLYYLLRAAGRTLFHQSWGQALGPVLAGCLVIVAVIIWRKFPVKDVPSLAHAAFWLMTADLCLATTVHPWYLSWAAVGLFLFPYAFMIYWTGASFLSYIAYSYRPVYEPTWVLLVEYLPMYALMIWEIRRGRPLLGDRSPVRGYRLSPFPWQRAACNPQSPAAFSRRTV